MTNYKMMCKICGQFVTGNGWDIRGVFNEHLLAIHTDNEIIKQIRTLNEELSTITNKLNSLMSETHSPTERVNKFKPVEKEV